MGGKSSKKKAVPTQSDSAHKSSAPSKPSAKHGPKGKNGETQIKLILVGDPGGGKTSLALRFLNDTFLEEEVKVLVDTTKVIKVDGESVEIDIHDTAGEERFRTITSSFYDGRHGVIVVFDLTRPNPFPTLQKWLQEVERYTEGDVLKILVGTKSDLSGDRSVSREDAKDFADKLGIAYVETSAKTGDRVEDVFTKLAKSILESWQEATAV